ncbi:MAG TPA: transglutaminase family protein [Candidatus Binataceae bacterium]|nr:transglutaminase family protein [Candidatus Binataceae bacterium]
MLTVRVGCDIHFECESSAIAIVLINPRFDSDHPVKRESLDFGDAAKSESFVDAEGNLANRVIMSAGLNKIRHDALVEVSTAYDKSDELGDFPSVATLDPALLRYLLPSRYCDSDRLLDFAKEKFGHVYDAGERVQAISDWIHNNIEYRFGSGRPDISAAQIIERGYGVCRDFAHCTIALCRASNIPARYVTGHLPDIGHIDPGTPMDFHAYSEVYLGGQWHVFDARYNEPRIGRVKIAHGLDAVDCAFATVYGPARLSNFEVWAYQVDPNEVAVGDPIDLSKRLDGVEEIRFAALAK